MEQNAATPGSPGAPPLGGRREALAEPAFDLADHFLLFSQLSP